MRVQMRPASRAAARGPAPSALRAEQREQMLAAAGDGPRGARRRRLLEHDVRVRAADAERADAGAARRAAGASTAAAGSFTKNGLPSKSICGFGVSKCRLGGSCAVLEREHGLDQPGDARGRVEMADVRLHRADARRSRAASVCAPERLGQRRDLDRIAERGAGAVRLDVADRLRRRRRRRPAPARSTCGLPVDARRGEADLQRAVVVDRRAADHRVDRGRRRRSASASRFSTTTPDAVPADRALRRARRTRGSARRARGSRRPR